LRRRRSLGTDSAEQIVPIVLDPVNPLPVVYVGCGTGAWLATFADHGVSRYLGIDGPYVDGGTLGIDPSRFIPADPRAPLSIGGERFDLALSLEVAEHLPEAVRSRVPGYARHSRARRALLGCHPLRGGSTT
jgi:hypothetical protein